MRKTVNIVKGVQHNYRLAKNTKKEELRGGSKKFERGVHNCGETVSAKILLINIHLFMKYVIQIINMPLPTRLL